ncbi:DUF340 domain-containing protein [Alkaliphilus sp. MSJ-5]|uniref:DUF340 domain-containing protein n=1 Tax=Alkaliphilus flagellatus TaxID=2841507 RepID=A0ABS6G665_9FIRM|nr:LysO family transporter [Alkaliphilus flagellatus]MBU5677977.1 DUF340 domain-containing protein [Alkaliphilus flagellatus]
MNIFLYLIILALGAYIGNKKLLKDSIMKKLDYIQSLSLLLLLFIMGVSIGMDKDVVTSFAAIGVQAIVLAVFSVAFSILGVKIISKKVLTLEEKREKSDC